MCFSQGISSILRSLLRQHWAAIGCTENGQPIGVTVHLKDELFSYFRGWVAVNWENTIFIERPVFHKSSGIAFN